MGAELTTRESFRLFVVYSSALIPLLYVITMSFKKKLPAWIFNLYFLSIIICALGWETWFTFGWIDGADVNTRRGSALNAALPQSINWLMNSLADGAIALAGLLMAWLAYGKNEQILQKWHWGAFGLMFTWFMAQNIFVETMIYHEQLSMGFKLSWAPLAPTGPYYNPVLFTLGDRTVSLQGQIPWLLMSPLFYWLALKLYSSNKKIVS
jgi:hypothetical protein